MPRAGPAVGAGRPSAGPGCAGGSPALGNGQIGQILVSWPLAGDHMLLRLSANSGHF